MIKECEGLRLKAYQDAVGVWTIGYGTTRGVKPGQIITTDEAQELLEADVMRFEPEVHRLVKVDLNSNQWDALLSFTYNLGASNLASSTLLKKLNSGDYAGAASEFERWVHAGGRRLEGLVRRRKAERTMFEGKDDGRA